MNTSLSCLLPSLEFVASVLPNLGFSSETRIAVAIQGWVTGRWGEDRPSPIGHPPSGHIAAHRAQRSAGPRTTLTTVPVVSLSPSLYPSPTCFPSAWLTLHTSTEVSPQGGRPKISRRKHPAEAAAGTKLTALPVKPHADV